MKGTIMNFRGSKHTQYSNHMIIVVDGVESREKALKLIGKKVTFKTPSGKEISGAVKNAHGNSGAVRAVFEKGMPGQSLAKSVSIE
jgi:large subunit ribosomal protein L35Ae